MLQLTTIFLLIAGSILAIVHYLAIELFLYWRFWWFDIPMHVLGGAVVALGIFTAFDLRLIKRRSLLSRTAVLGFVLLAAIAWELFEIWAGVPIEREGFVLDTTADLLMGLLGGYLGYYVSARIRKL